MPEPVTASSSASSSEYESVIASPTSDTFDSATLPTSGAEQQEQGSNDGLTTPTAATHFSPEKDTDALERQKAGLSISRASSATPGSSQPLATSSNFSAIPLLQIVSPSSDDGSSTARLNPASPRYLKPRQSKLSAKNSASAASVEAGWDAETPTNGMVIQYGTSNEIERHITTRASTNMLRPAANPNSGWLFCKIFSEDSFAACGRIHILQGGVKASKSVKDNTYMFYVLDGAVNVKVHETQYIVCTDGLFIVPRGNVYKIENISSRTAKLLFFQAREVASGEDPLIMRNSMQVPSLPTQKIITVAGFAFERLLKRFNYLRIILLRWYTRTSFAVGRRLNGPRAYWLYFLLGFVLRGLLGLRGTLRRINVQMIHAPPR